MGVDLPKNKKGFIGLTFIYGIGIVSAKKILKYVNVDYNIKVKYWNDNNINKIRKFISENFKVEGELRSYNHINIKRLVDIGSYRGIRHRLKLPLRGQKTKNNCRTRKGKRKTVSNKKKILKK